MKTSPQTFSKKSLAAIGFSCAIAASVLTCAWAAQSAALSSNQHASGNIKRIHRLGLVPGDMLLESVREFIQKQGIRDGALLSGIGSLSECRIHWPKEPTNPPEDVFHTFTGALEITGIQGIIADGEPHFHISLAEKGDVRTLGGHLEDGSKVLYLAELTIAEFDGPPMTRRPNQYNVKMLQVK